MPPILQELKEYIETRLKLLKYETADRAFAIIADLIADLVIMAALAMCFIFLTVALAFFLGTIFKSLWAGFGIVCLIYVLILFLNHLLKNFFQTHLVKMLIRKLFKLRGDKQL
jgi:hypothetical protein